jgi:hypothetical protein
MAETPSTVGSAESTLNIFTYLGENGSKMIWVWNLGHTN